jgi:hypothetical protein
VATRGVIQTLLRTRLFTSVEKDVKEARYIVKNYIEILILCLQRTAILIWPVKHLLYNKEYLKQIINRRG